MKLQKNYKGVTMVEVIVSMLIVAIIMVFASSFFFTSEKMFSNAISGNTNKMIGDNVLSFVSERLKYASTIEIAASGTVASNPYENFIWTNTDKRLGFETTEISKDNIFGNDFYNDNKIQVTTKVLDNNCLSIQVRVLSSNETDELYSTSNVIKLMNFNLAGSTIGGVGTEIINPNIYYESLPIEIPEEIADDSSVVTPGGGTPQNVTVWDESLFEKVGNSGKYKIKLDTNKIYSFNGVYYKSNSGKTVNNLKSNTLTPLDSPLNNYFSEYVAQ